MMDKVGPLSFGCHYNESAMSDFHATQIIERSHELVVTRLFVLNTQPSIRACANLSCKIGNLRNLRNTTCGTPHNVLAVFCV
jgi:hypothetical protein